MTKQRILIFFLCLQLSSGIVWAATAPVPADPGQMTEISIGLKEKPTNKKEEARLAFNHNKEILDTEFHKQLNELDDSEASLGRRKEIIREYNAKLHEMRKALKQDLGIKETSFNGPPAVYTVKPSSGTEYYDPPEPAENPKLKAFQKEPKPAKRYHKKNRNKLDFELQ